MFRVVIGIGASIITQRAMRSLLFGVTDSGAVALSIGVVVLTVAGLAAVLIPARRAASVEPMEALHRIARKKDLGVEVLSHIF